MKKMPIKTNKKILIIVNKFGQGGTFNAALNFAFGYKNLGHSPQIIYFKKKNHRKDLKSYIKKKNINCLNANKFNFEKKIDYVHIIGHDIRCNYIKKIRFSYKDIKIFESNIFGKKNDYDMFLDASWQLNTWNNFKYIYSGGKKNYGILPLPVNFDILAQYKKQLKKERTKRNSLSILKVSQDSEGKWSKELIDVFCKIYQSNRHVSLTLVTPPQSIINYINKLELKIKKKIIIIKKINKTKDIFRLYLNSNIFLHMTQQGETFGYVFFEANYFGCNMLCNETPWADNSQVEILRELYSTNTLYNNNYSIIKSINKLILEKKKIFVRKKCIKKYSPKYVCSQAMKLMASNKQNIIRFSRKKMCSLLSNPNKDLLSTIKSLFLKTTVYLFSIYSLVIFKKLKRLNLL